MVRRGYIIGALTAALIALVGCESDRAGELLAPLFFSSPAETETVIDHHEPNDSLNLAIPIVPDNQPFATAFHRLSDVDYFTFIAAGGVCYTIRTEALDPGVATRISVVNERDVAIVTGTGGGAQPGEVLIRWTPDSSGTYGVRVTSVGSSIGTYHLVIGIASDEYEPDNTIADANHIVGYDGTHHERTFHALDDVDYLVFSGHAGFTYSVHAAHTALPSFPSASVSINVLDGLGTELATNVPLLNTAVSVTPLTDGDYYVRVAPVNAATLGVYTVSVTIGDDPFEPDNSIAQASAITVNGSSQLRGIGPYDEDYVSFAVEDSVQYSISATDLSTGVELEISVHHVSGAQLGVLVDEGIADQHLWRWTSPANLNAADRFYIRIRCKNDLYGTYRLTITRD